MWSPRSKASLFFFLSAWLLQGHLNTTSQWPLLPRMARTTLSPSHKFISLLPKVWGWDSDVVLISPNHCSTKPTTFYTWMEDTPLVIWVSQHICFPELCCQLPVDLSAWSVLWNLSWERVQLSMESFWFFTLFYSAGSRQSPNQPIITKNHFAKYPCSSPTVDQTSTFSPNGSWSSNWMLCYHDLFFYWMQVKVQTEKKFGPPATNLLNSHCGILFSMPLDELLGLPQIFIQLHFDNNELQ